MSAIQQTLFDTPAPRRAGLGKQKHNGVDPVLDVPRLTTQFGRILSKLLDKNWHTQYELAAQLEIPQGSIGSQIRNARVAGWIVSKRRRGKSGTWGYRLEGKKL